ncbi:MAG: hypothetical protein QOD83_1723 [Solirubrobacteraceae bacterium]|jgi:hypothetical protein|nr:hypothetical protein [Solirubrobacteraceae bacterium]
MRSRVSRHLNPVLLDSDVMFAARGQPLGAPPPEFNWRDYTAMLLHVAAEIEHSLMVQYLFAAYSLGGPRSQRSCATRCGRGRRRSSAWPRRRWAT